MTASELRLVFLIGYRGTGKTAVARLLAERLGWSWLDADKVLEERAGKTIREVFAEEGEPGFRDREAAVLADLCGLEDHVIATGGGVVLREDNRRCLRRGRAVWLTADAETIWNRLQKDATTAERRPDLAQGGLQEIEELLRQRTSHYVACADLIVDTTVLAPTEIATRIQHWLLSKHA